MLDLQTRAKEIASSPHSFAGQDNAAASIRALKTAPEQENELLV